MYYSFAPMEGITDDLFRRLHHKYFPGTDRYYTPFFSPGLTGHVLSKKDISQLLPENNAGVPLVPQLLTRQAEAFLESARIIADLGYREINLNLGCPSGTVVAKGKGSGFLALSRRQELEEFLDRIFAACPTEISVKTRLGKEAPEEFEALLRLFDRYPIRELTIHPRIQTDFYRKPVRMEWFSYAQQNTRLPLCLSGGVAKASDLKPLLAQGIAPEGIMLGRGFVADPGLVMKLKGMDVPDRSVYENFCGELFDLTAARLGDPRSTMFRMKELWSYFILLFDQREKYWKILRKSTSLTEYQATVIRIFRELPLRQEAEINWS